MSATSLQVWTDIVSNPEWEPGELSFHRVNANISYSYLLSWDIRTLSIQNADPGEPISGLLYVPDLEPSDPCIQESAPWVPANVTRQRNLPQVDYEKLIAIAPWVSGECTLNYLAAARLDPIRGFLFFLPNNGTFPPPQDSSDVWHIDSSSDDWKRDNEFPVYALPGASGNSLMAASAMYSQNMTDVPNGHFLTEAFDSRDYVRLFINISYH